MEFSNCIRKSFSFLISLGYSEEVLLNNIVRYYCNDFKIEICCDYIGCEVAVYITDNNASKTISMQDLLNYLCIDEKGMYQFNSDKQIVLAFDYLAKALKQALKVMNNNCDAVCKAFAFSEQKRKDKAFEIELKRELDIADEYFKEKDYIKAMEIYRKYKPYLSELCKKRLDYINAQV